MRNSTNVNQKINLYNNNNRMPFQLGYFEEVSSNNQKDNANFNNHDPQNNRTSKKCYSKTGKCMTKDHHLVGVSGLDFEDAAADLEVS